MKQHLLNIQKKVDAMTLRERAIMFVTITVALLALVNILVLDPQLVKQRKLSDQMRQDRATIAELEYAIQQKVRAFNTDPNIADRARLTELKQQFVRVQGGFVDLQKKLVSPNKMATVLEDILKRNGKLKLISMKTLPVVGFNDVQPPSKNSQDKSSTADNKPSALGEKALETMANIASPGKIVEQQKGAADQDKKDVTLVDSNIYKHGVEITMQGSYLDLANYVAELEAMPWQLFWSKAKLNVEEYPKTTLTLTLFTLSLDKKWLNL